MRLSVSFALLLLGWSLVPSLHAQPDRARLLADFDRAMQRSTKAHRVTQAGDRIVLRSQLCTTTIPVARATRAESVNGTSGEYRLRFRASSIPTDCGAFDYTDDSVVFDFLLRSSRDAAVTAAQALLRGWNAAPAPRPTPLVSPNSLLESLSLADKPSVRTERGRLAFGDDLAPGDKYADSYTVRVRPGDALIVDLQSTNFDPYLVLISPSEEAFSNDDWQNSRSRSRIEVDRPEAGTWTVAATSFEARATGAYTLQIATDGSSIPSGDDRTSDAFAAAIIRLIRAAPSFSSVRGSLRATTEADGFFANEDRRTYNASVTVPGADDTTIRCGADCLVVITEGRYHDETAARAAFDQIFQRIAYADLPGGPYEPSNYRNGDSITGINLTAPSGLVVSTRFIANPAAALLGEPPYRVSVTIFPPE